MFNPLGDGPVDASLVLLHALASGIGAADSLDDACAAFSTVLAAWPGTPISQGVVALWTVAGVAVGVQIRLIDPQTAYLRRRGNLLILAALVTGSLKTYFGRSANSLRPWGDRNGGDVVGAPSVVNRSPHDGPRLVQAVVVDHLVHIRGLAVANKDALAPPRPHVAVGVVLRSFSRELVEHGLGKAHHLLAKWPAADARPRGQAVLASHRRVQDERRVLQQPRDDRVRDGDVLAQPCLEAQFESSEQSSQHHDAHFGRSIRLGVIFRWLFAGELLEVLELDLRDLDHAGNEGLQRRLIVGLEDGGDVAEPLEVVRDEPGHVVLLICALAWDDMSHHDLRLGTPEHNALHDVATPPRLLRRRVALFGHRRFKLLSLLQATLGDVEVVQADQRDDRSHP